jgi:hypothetical protein
LIMTPSSSASKPDTVTMTRTKVSNSTLIT